MSDAAQQPWWRFRRRAVQVSVAVSVLSAVGLLVIYHYEPSAVPAARATEEGKLDPRLFNALQALLTTVLSVGLISLLFEVALRESFGRDLYKFLRLRTALATSGLEDIAAAPNIEWDPILEGASEVRALIRDPSQWVDPHLPSILDACQKRGVLVVIGVPDPDGEHFAVIAESVGLTADALQQNIESMVTSAENQWKNRDTRLHPGSSFSVVPYREVPMYETVIADDRVVCMLSKVRHHERGAYPLVLSFDQDRLGFPSQWLRQPLEELERANAMWSS